MEIRRAANQGLGISIVGGKLEPEGDSQPLSGIFIKNVLPGSPAAALGVLNTGDRILAVGEVDLRTASHDTAVEAIRQAGNPLRLCVQSLRMWEEEEEEKEEDEDEDDEDKELEEEVDVPTLDRTLGGEELVVPASLTVSPHSKVSPPEEFSSQPGPLTPPPAPR